MRSDGRAFGSRRPACAAPGAINPHQHNKEGKGTMNNLPVLVNRGTRFRSDKLQAERQLAQQRFDTQLAGSDQGDQ